MTAGPSLRLGVALLVGALGAGGCAAGGLAAVGPVLSALQIVGDRSVDRTLAVDLPTALALSEEALARTAIVINASTATDDGWLLRGTSQDLTISVTLGRATARLTRVSVRVEAGRITADKQTGEELQNQIARLLAERLDAGRSLTSTQTEALASLEAQVRTLRIELERRQATSTPPAARPVEPRPVVTVDESAIVSIPASYGFVTPQIAVTAFPVAPAPQPAQAAVAAPTLEPPPVHPTALESATTLTAVPALNARNE